MSKATDGSRLCACGCGSPTNPAARNDPKRGYIRGVPHKYVVGHANKNKILNRRACQVASNRKRKSVRVGEARLCYQVGALAGKKGGRADRARESGEAVRDPAIHTTDGGEEWFDTELGLALLLKDGVLFANSRRYLDPEMFGGKPQEETIVLFVNCNDVFAWGTAEAEAIAYDEVPKLYKSWRADKVWGSTRWCCLKRGEQPQAPVAEDMKKAGAWDAAMDALKPNHYDAFCREKAGKLKP